MFSWHNKKSKQVVSAVIAIILILAMVLPLLVSTVM